MPLTNPLPHWILFDAVGTLIRLRCSVSGIYAVAGRAHGSHLEEAAIRTRFRDAFQLEFGGANRFLPTSETDQIHRWERLVQSVFEDVRPVQPLFQQLWQEFAKPETWQIYDDVFPVLDQLKNQGHSLAVASNFDRRLNGILAGLGVIHTLQQVFTSAEIGFSKPNPAFFSTIVSRLGIRPRDCLMVGDDPECDRNGAWKAGWQAVWIERNPSAKDGSGVESQRIRSLRELLPGENPAG